MAKPVKKKGKRKAIKPLTPFGLILDDQEEGADDVTPDVDSAEQQDEPAEKKSMSILERHPDILELRFNGRRVPKVDDGFNKKNALSDDALKRFYHDARVDEFLRFVTSNGKKMIKFEFGKMLDGYAIDTDNNGENQIIRMFSYAEISKRSFINNMNIALRYTNYFITYFDDDDELMAAYLEFMMQLHYNKLNMPVESFIDTLYALIATPSMVQKVIRMVEYNTDESLIKKTDERYDESIQLTVEHLKAIMGVTCFQKFIIPVVSHYYAVRQNEVKASGLTDRELYYQVFLAFVPLFDDYYDIRLYEKLYHTATTRISKTENHDSQMWKRRERFGVTPTSFTNVLMQGFLNDIAQKIVFNQSAIIFLHVCFDKAIKNELIQPDKHEMSDMRMDASDSVNGIYSRWDRWQMGCTGNSERERLRAYASIRDMIWRMGNDVGLKFHKYEYEHRSTTEVSDDPDVQEEYEYYLEHISRPMNETQEYIINLYCSKELGAPDDVKMMKFEDKVQIIMIMKRDLRSRNYSYIPFFISSKVKPEATRRYNNNSLKKLFMSNPLYEDWEEELEDTKELMNMSKFLGELKTLISCPIICVEFDSELEGRVMNPADIIVADEWARFMNEL
ncbi:hypothetical protein [uncultured Duncaniella sp.]|uniref:hypothetical protein n=1 Tax=uncultured Duncaniella sp. TaxID=2768039 RepID=UPI00261DA659|nr:hypothetical protein [uncultured Duncaniella sp.]